MRQVLKYFVNESVSFTHEISKDAKFLKVDLQHDTPQMWFEVDKEKQSDLRVFKILGTGWDIPDNYVYLGTYLSPGQNFVWHLYEIY